MKSQMSERTLLGLIKAFCAKTSSTASLYIFFLIIKSANVCSIAELICIAGTESFWSYHLLIDYFDTFNFPLMSGFMSLKKAIREFIFVILPGRGFSLCFSPISYSSILSRLFASFTVGEGSLSTKLLNELIYCLIFAYFSVPLLKEVKVWSDLSILLSFHVHVEIGSISMFC